MSALTDFFTSLANKIRSKLGTSTAYTPAQAVSAIDDVYSKGVSDTKVGTAVASDVRSGKTFTNSSGVGLTGTYVGEASKLTTHCVNKLIYTSTWIAKTWNGFYPAEAFIDGEDIWSDGDNIYYSANSKVQYVLDKSTSTWVAKTWNGITDFSGNYIWSDGTNIYYSYNTAQYVLDKSTSTWIAKTWNGFSKIYGRCIWSDGDNIYHSTSGGHYILDKSTSTWVAKTWNGFSNFNGGNIWSDGTNIYYSYGTTQYVLDKSTSTWSTKTWSGVDNFDGVYIWTDGTDIFYSYKYNHYLLGANGWIGISGKWIYGNYELYGSNIWTDGTNIYHSDGSGRQQVLVKSNFPVVQRGLA